MERLSSGQRNCSPRTQGMTRSLSSVQARGIRRGNWVFPLILCVREGTLLYAFSTVEWQIVLICQIARKWENGKQSGCPVQGQDRQRGAGADTRCAPRKTRRAT